MTVTNPESGTNVHEIVAGIYRISTPVAAIPGGFTFNQFLVVDDAPLLFHTGLRQIFPLVREAVAHVLGDAAKLRYVGFSHFEADECGSLNDWLAVAPGAEPVCSTTAAMLSVNDFADRPALALSDGQELPLGRKRMRWLDAPHLPHNWECGYLFDATTRSLTDPMSCATPVSSQDLTLYWAGELAANDLERVDEHLMRCAVCTAQSGRLSAVVEALRAFVPPIVTRAKLERLRQRGVRIAENTFAPGLRQAVVFSNDIDLLIRSRAHGRLPNPARVSVAVLEPC